MISIVNYGVGNIRALINIYKRLDKPARIVSTAEELAGAEKLLLPGVGSFDWAMARLDNSGMRTVLDDLILRRGKLVLGICVGMQMMAKRSDEGVRPGLGWIEAEVKKIDRSISLDCTYLPHMGWNDVVPRNEDGLFKGIGTSARFYFLHSYHVVTARREMILAETEYCGTFASSIQFANIYGVQFHPEKSHQWGVQLLKNFAEL